MKGAKANGKVKQKRDVYADDPAYDFSDCFAYNRCRCFVRKFMKKSLKKEKSYAKKIE